MSWFIGSSHLSFFHTIVVFGCWKFCFVMSVDLSLIVTLNFHCRPSSASCSALILYSLIASGSIVRSLLHHLVIGFRSAASASFVCMFMTNGHLHRFWTCIHSVPCSAWPGCWQTIWGSTGRSWLLPQGTHFRQWSFGFSSWACCSLGCFLRSGPYTRWVPL